MKEKLIKATQLIFAYGMSALLIIALLVAAAYVVAFAIGMPGSAEIEVVVAGILPVVYVSSIGLSFIGIFNMYLRGEQTFRLEIKKENKENT